MTQEILDYLLIRCYLLNYTGEELIEIANNNSYGFKVLMNSIAKLMQEEDYVLVSSEFEKRVSELLYHYRFDYNKDKEINDNMNYIIGRLNDYKNMPFSYKKRLAIKWRNNEIAARKLPKNFHDDEVLLDLVALDGHYIVGIANYDKPFEVDNIIEYLSLINLLISKYPNCFEDFSFYLAACQNVTAIKNLENLPLSYKIYIEKTLRRLKKLDKCDEYGFVEAEKENKTKKIGKRF